MKRKFADKSNWSRVLKKQFKLTYVDDEEYRGYVSMIKIEKIKYPLIKTMNNRDYRIADEGYIWLSHIPKDKHYAITTMFNEDGKIIQWYFDIIKDSGVNDKGIPYFDDLYLDVVFLPSQEIILLDEDELNQALKIKDITEDEFKLAYREAENVIDKFGTNIDKLKDFSNQQLERLIRA